jgi:hypothetical protein
LKEWDDQELLSRFLVLSPFRTLNGGFRMYQQSVLEFFAHMESSHLLSSPLT